MKLPKMKKIALIILCFNLFFSAFAQETKPQTTQETFRIISTDISTDTTGFTTISTTIELMANIQPTKDDFSIQNEDLAKLEILSLEKQGEESGKMNTRLIYFLIDASNYTDGFPINSFKEAVTNSLDDLTENDLINVGFFGSSGRDLTPFGNEFSSNFGLFESDINSRVTASLDSANTSDIFKAMYEAMDALSKSTKEGQKILILLSGAVLNPNSTYKRDDIVDRARKLGIIIHTVNYKINNQYSPDDFKIISNKTDGTSANAIGTADVKNAIGDFLEERVSGKDTEAGNPKYVLTFQSPYPRDGIPHTYKVIYQGTEQTATYTLPGGGGGFSLFGNYTIWIVIIVGLLLGLAYWQYNEMRIRRLEEEEADAELEAEREAQAKRKEQEQQSLLQDIQEKNMRLQEQLRMKEMEIAQKSVQQEIPTVVPNPKFDLKNTIISGGGGAPILMIAAGAFSNNFMLNKPTITIGRAANNDIAVPEQTVSSRHATITIENGSFFLTDLGSTNGTFVNGSRIEKKLLKSGDIIKFGAANAKFEI